MHIKITSLFLTLTILCTVFTGCTTGTSTPVIDSVSPTQTIASTASTEASGKDNAVLFDGYTLIEVDGGDLSGYRQPNVVVDVGFGDRLYYAFTNEYGQLIKVIADEIILQNDNTEHVTEEGRYYPDEAKVPGTEASDLDEGHVIADSLGGVSNAYNITPQDSTLNRFGDQAYMEKVISDAGGCTDFTAIITYPDTSTQIPSHYSFTYTLKGNIINDEFDNVNPDEANAALVNNPTIQSVNQSAVSITMLNKKAEYVEITNESNENIDMTGWYIVSVRGNQIFNFPNEYILFAEDSINVASGNTDGDILWTTENMWNNSDSDPAELYDNNGILISRWDD